MSGFGRALAGLGAGAAGLASRYIDEELAQQRAQALSDIQFANAKRTEQWQQSDEVQTPRLMNQRRTLEMQNQVTLQGKESEASSPTLRQARVDNEVAMLEGTTPARIKAENAIVEGTSGTKLDAERTRRLVLDPMDVAKAAATSDAAWAARERYDQRLDGKAAKSAYERLPEGKKLEVQQIAAELKEINKAVIEAQASGGWDSTKNPGQKQLEVAKAALQTRLRGLLEGGEDDPLNLFNGDPGGAPAPAKDVPKKPDTNSQGSGASAEPGPVRSLFNKAANWFAETGRDYSTQEGKAALRQRVAEAQSGGQPLTRVEQMRAQQLGLI